MLFLIEAKFDQEANFIGATFTKQANFFGTKFVKQASFPESKFTEGVNFNKAIFKKQVNFNQAIFQGSNFFNEAKFYEKAIDFSQVILSADSNLIFSGTRFYHTVPDFRYLNNAPDIRFHKFFVPSPDKLDQGNKWHKDDDNEDRYRKLKELAIGNHNHEYELIFYGYEMNSKLKSFYKEKDKRFFSKRWVIDIVPTFLYKKLSNYGQSILLPFVVLVVLVLGSHYIGKLDWSAVFKTIMPLPLFVTNINSLGNLGNVDVSSIEWISDNRLTIKTIATVFWFFLFLGLRNKFKIK